jgi:hypothetical protein
MKKIVDKWEALPHFEQHVRCLPMVETALLPCRWKCCRVLFLLIQLMSVMVDRFVASGPFCFIFSLLPWKLQVGLLFFFYFFSVSSLNSFLFLLRILLGCFLGFAFYASVDPNLMNVVMSFEGSHEFTLVFLGLFRSFFKFNFFFNLILQHLIYWTMIFMLLFFHFQDQIS